MNRKWSILFSFFLLSVLIFPGMADTSLSDSTYFYDPLGDANSWSFEGSPHGWTTNNGGSRSNAQHLDGSYSWYTSGGGDYYMWRYVDSSHALNAIKGKKVKFSFWFYPETVASDGSENEARAEVYYEYTTGGGGGGGGGGGCGDPEGICLLSPTLFVWNGLQYVLDNNLMPSSESAAGDVTDYYLLQQSLVPNAEGLYSLLLSEFEEEHSLFDQVQLLAVDHLSNVSVAVSPYGEILTYTVPSQPVSTIDDNSKNVKHLLSAMDDYYYEGYNGSHITLNFGDELDVSQGAKLVMRANLPPESEKW